jgi:hypothetical protein
MSLYDRFSPPSVIYDNPICLSFSTSCVPQHRALRLELMLFVKIEFRNSICVEKNGNKWRWAPRLPSKTLASGHEGVVASPRSNGSEGACAYAPPYIVRAPSWGVRTPPWGRECLPDGTHHHGGRVQGTHVRAPHGRVWRARVSSGSRGTLTRHVRACGGAHGSRQGPA